MISKLAFDNNGEPVGSFEQGMEWAVEAIGEMLGVSANDYSWDAATEEWEGDVKAVMNNMLTAALGENWLPNCKGEGYTLDDNGDTVVCYRKGCH